MSLLDQGIYAAVGLAEQKLPALSQQAVHLGTDLYKRWTESPKSNVKTTSNSFKDPLSAAQNRQDPLMNYNWWCDMPGLNGGQQQLSWEFIEEATLPFIEFTPVSNYRAGKEFHYAQKYDIGSLDLKFYEDSSGTSTTYMTSWQSLILNPESGTFYYPKDYKKTITIWVMDVAKFSVMSLIYTGCWPTRLDNVSLGSANSERVVLGANFSVDGLQVNFGKFDAREIPSVMSAVGSSFPPKAFALPDIFPSNFVNFSFA